MGQVLQSPQVQRENKPSIPYLPYSVTQEATVTGLTAPGGMQVSHLTTQGQNLQSLQENGEAQRHQDNTETKTLLQRNGQIIHQSQQSQQSVFSYICLVSGPGLQSATANHPTYIIVELNDCTGRPCSRQHVQNVSAQLQSPRIPFLVYTAITVISPCQYVISYTASERGQHKLHVRINGSEINGSPFTMTVYPDPTQLGFPVRVVANVNGPYGIAVNRHGEKFVTECGGHHISAFNVRGHKIRTFGSNGTRPGEMLFPTGIAVDDADAIYVSSEHKLQKFTSSGKLIKCVGQGGSNKGEFDDPRGITIHSNQVYVCDSNNHRIQVFDMNLKFIQSIGSYGSGRGEFVWPQDIAFDAAGHMFVAELGNKRIQVMSNNGHFIRRFGQGGKRSLRGPVALHIADKYVYVSDYWQHCIVVYHISGLYVTSFGRRGQGRELSWPKCITSCANGFIYVCDSCNSEIQTF